MKRRKRPEDTPPPQPPTDPTPTPPTTPPQPTPDPTPTPKEVEMVRLISIGHSQTDAYRIALSPKIKRKSAATRASKLMARPSLARLLAEYTAAPIPGATAPTTTPAAQPVPLDDTQQPSGDEPPIEGYLTLDEAKERVTKAVRSATNSTDITQALKLAQTVLGLSDDDKPPDPVTIIRYITQAAGRPHPQIAQELGGLRWMLERVVSFAKVPPSHVRKTIRAWDRELRAQADQGIQQGIQPDDETQEP